MTWKIVNKANSWEKYVRALDSLRQDERGKAFELLTELFLQIDPIYRSKLKHVWHESNLPPNVRQKLGLPSPDIGVDLVAEDRSGAYWAIQCKYHHDPGTNVTKNELNSFLDVTTRVCRGKFKTLLAVSSAHGYSIHLQKHAPEVQYVLSDAFQSLDEDFFRQARALIRKQTPKLRNRTPRPHQKVAIKNAVRHFIKDGESRGKLIHPCGTGKSLIGYWIAEALEAKTIIVALPSLYLVRQTLADWTKESLALQKQMDWLVVCSEDTIGDSGDPSMRFQEIGVDVTTKVDDISAFLRKRSRGKKVIFTTYQSGIVTAKAARKANRIFDVGIFDEAHRTVGQSDSMFAHLIDEENIRIRKRVFMTATERRYQGSSETILSMDDAGAYGATFDKMTFKEALEAKNPILSDYKIVTMVIGRSEVEQLIKRNFLVKPDKGKWDHDTAARTLAALIALRKAMRRYRANHALTFHNSIAKAAAFKESQKQFNGAVKGYGKVDCYHVSSKVSTGERKLELERFRHSDKALITNAKCLTEGVDVPTIDAVLFADTKRSTVDIVQAAGRALRRAPNKKMGYIIVPTLVDEDDPEAADKAFQDILMTLRAMASNDDRIIDYFRSVNHGERLSRSDSILEFVVPDSIKVRMADFVASVETQSWHRLARLSWMPFDEARACVRSLGLRNSREWTNYCTGRLRKKPEKPKDIPANPHKIYADRGWAGMVDWLGTANPLTVEIILTWADGYYEQNKKWPTRNCGDVEVAPDENWGGIDRALRSGSRGLPSGVSLAALLTEFRNYRNQATLLPITEEQILQWADDYFQTNGRWPNKSSDKVKEGLGETWSGINAALRLGLRGLQGGCTLAQLLAEKRGYLYSRNRPKLTTSQILGWADAYKAQHGEWPFRNSGAINDAPGETWGAINAALLQGSRGLPGGRSLAQLMAEKRGYRNPKARSKLTINNILSWADAHHERYGEWPTAASGQVHGEPGEKWSGINRSLYRGQRGLPANLSLARLLGEKRGVRRTWQRPELTEKQILRWADEYFAKHKKWPRTSSGTVEGTSGENWSAINQALGKGVRGLPGGGSLSKLLKPRRERAV